MRPGTLRCLPNQLIRRFIRCSDPIIFISLIPVHPGVPTITPRCLSPRPPGCYAGSSLILLNMSSGLVVVQKISVYSAISVWDAVLHLLNLVLFKRPVKKVTPEGCPGYGGYWPEYRSPKEGDSRGPCPGLNAMANHGMWDLWHEDRLLILYQVSSLETAGISSSLRLTEKFVKPTIFRPPFVLWYSTMPPSC